MHVCPRITSSSETIDKVCNIVLPTGECRCARNQKPGASQMANSFHSASTDIFDHSWNLDSAVYLRIKNVIPEVYPIK